MVVMGPGLQYSWDEHWRANYKSNRDGPGSWGSAPSENKHREKRSERRYREEKTFETRRNFRSAKVNFALWGQSKGVIQYS